MRKAIVCVLFFSLVLFCNVPRLISYQGRLTDGTGSPLTGAHNITFRLYTVETGGTPVWQEMHSETLSSDGLYDVMLGSITPLSVDFSEQYWLGVSVDGGAEMTPRFQLGASPYALNLASLGAADGQVLKWDATNGKWIPASDETGGAAAPGEDTRS